MSDLRRKRTKQLIFNAFDKILRVHSFSSITINEIAAASELHRNTFYLHFTDKYDLLHQFILFSLLKASKIVSVESYSQMPFHVIHELYMTSYQELFNRQRNDEEFMSVFSKSFTEMFGQKLHNSHNIWTMGGVSAILKWNRMNGNPYDMFKDYQKLDKIYQDKQFPNLK